MSPCWHAAIAALSLGTSPGEPAAEVFPARARPGDAFLLEVRGAAAAPSAAVAGHALHFHPAPGGGFRAVAGLPIETQPGTLDVEVSVPVEGRGTRKALARLEVTAPDFATAELSVAKRFVQRPTREVRRRIAADRAAFARAQSQPPSPPMFEGGFAWPREGRLTGRFGDRRMFNGRKESQHYGVDLAGKMGDPVSAANAGRVVLVRDCWASGRSIVVWHGAGLYSFYFHLSRTLVRPGAIVSRGERIGLVGRSGRVTGPHLHWSTKVGGLQVDPESVLRLPL